MENFDFTGEELLGSEENWEAAVGFYRLGFADKPFAPFYLSWISLFYLLYKVLELSREAPASDVYHSLNAGYEGLLGCLFKLGIGSPLIVTEHGLYLKERRFELENSDVPKWLHGMYENFFASLVKTSYRYSDTVTSVCRDHVVYQKTIDSTLEPRVIYNGVDTQRFSYVKPMEEGGCYKVGTVGRVTPIKDTITFIRAAKDVVQKHDAKFYVVGEIQDEDYFEDCKELVDELGLGSDIFFTGFQDSREWYPKFDLFVLTSLSEGFPLTILEALSSGVPCIATDVGGVPEILDDEMLVRKWDPGSLAMKISSLLGDPYRRELLSLRGRHLVESKFSLSGMIEEYRGLYEVVV